jgi:hypothetical protein
MSSSDDLLQQLYADLSNIDDINISDLNDPLHADDDDDLYEQYNKQLLETLKLKDVPGNGRIAPSTSQTTYETAAAEFLPSSTDILGGEYGLKGLEEDEDWKLLTAVAEKPLGNLLDLQPVQLLPSPTVKNNEVILAEEDNRFKSGIDHLSMLPELAALPKDEPKELDEATIREELQGLMEMLLDSVEYLASLHYNKISSGITEKEEKSEISLAAAKDVLQENIDDLLCQLNAREFTEQDEVNLVQSNGIDEDNLDAEKVHVKSSYEELSSQQKHLKYQIQVADNDYELKLKQEYDYARKALRDELEVIEDRKKKRRMEMMKAKQENSAVSD